MCSYSVLLLRIIYEDILIKKKISTNLELDLKIYRSIKLEKIVNRNLNKNIFLHSTFVLLYYFIRNITLFYPEH